MQNSEKKAIPMSMSPRISFSIDLVDDSHSQRGGSGGGGGGRRDSINAAPAAASSENFEFSVSNYSMMSGADELFCKGRLLPYKESGGSKTTAATTLREELLMSEEDEFISNISRPPKNPSTARWRGFLGLRKSHIGSRRPDKSALQHTHVPHCTNKNSQEEDQDSVE